MELADFDDKQIKTYAHRWFHGEPETAQKFLEQLYQPENAGIRELAAVPIMLNLLCLTFEAAYRLPRRRSELYERAITTLLEHWDASRRIDRAETEAYEPYRQLSTVQKKRLLARVAAETFAAEDYFWPRPHLEAEIVKAVSRLPNLGQQADGGAILRAIAAHHGLFIERAADIYAFAHLSFHEYFTACFIVENEARGTLKQLLTPARITDPRWREVLLLTAEMLNEADDFFTLFRQAVAHLLTTDRVLIDLADWAAARAIASMESQSNSILPRANLASLRAFYFFLARAHALAHPRDLNLDLNLNRTRALACDLALALAPDLTLDRDRILDRHLARDLTLTLDLNLDKHLDLTLGSRPALDAGLTTAWLAGRIFLEFSAKGEDIQAQVNQLVHYLAWLIELSRRLNATVLSDGLTGLTNPSATATPRVWAAFCSNLTTLMQIRCELRLWELTEAQTKQLARYFEANRLLLECLERADVADREGIKRRLLLPESKSVAFEPHGK